MRGGPCGVTAYARFGGAGLQRIRRKYQLLSTNNRKDVSWKIRKRIRFERGVKDGSEIFRHEIEVGPVSKEKLLVGLQLSGWDFW